jgi:hypothetical protein
MSKLGNPYPLFLDGRGALLDAGYIYVGTANTDPKIVANRLPLFFDPAMTIPAPQPLRTLGGVIVNNQNPALVYLVADDYSQTVTDADGILVHYAPSFAATGGGGGGPVYQLQDADLTAIAALATTAYGRSLLTLANQAALKSATGIPDCLPLTGGTVTGNILRGAAGGHLYHTTASMINGRVYLTAAGAADPTSQPGDIWLTY